MKTTHFFQKLNRCITHFVPAGFKNSPAFLLTLLILIATSQVFAASPVANSFTAPSVANQASGTRFMVPKLTGNDAEDGALGGPTSTVKILLLPTTATLYYNSVAVALNQIITNYDSTALTFSPTTTSATTVTFNFTFIDANGNSGNTATATLPLNQLGFPCDGQLKFTRQISIPGHTTSTVLSYPLFDYATGNFDTKDIDTFLDKDFNASVYYNGYIYAFKQTSTVALYELHPDGTSTVKSTTGVALTANFNNAGVDRNGIMYILGTNSYTLYKIDLKTSPATATSVTCTGIADAASNAIWGDMVMDPQTGTMYVWYHPTSGSTSQGLYSLNLTTNVFTHVGSTVSQTMGSLMYDNFDRLFAYGSTTLGASQDRLWQIDKSTALPTPVGVPDITVAQSDGTSCSFKFSTGLTPNTRCIKAGSAFSYTALISNYTNYVPKNAFFRDTLDNRLSFTTPAATLQTTLRSIYGNAATVTYSNYNGGTNNLLTVSGMSIPNLELDTFNLGVSVNPGAIFTNGETIDNFAYVTNVVGYNGGVERSSDQNKNTPNSPARIYAYIPATAGVTSTLGSCTATLTATPSTGVAYQWANTGGNIGGATSVTYATSTPSTYTVTVSINVVDTAKCYSTASVVVNPCVSGTVFNDVNSISNSLIDGTGTNVGGTLYASLVSGNTALKTVAIASDGSYAFPNTTPGNYTVLISTTSYAVNAVNPVASVPAGYVNTSEAISPAFNDATPANGVIAVTVAGTNISGANFGIEQPPSVGSGSNTATNPGGVIQVTVPANTFTNLGNSTDPTTNTVTNIRITGFPSGASSIVINNVTYTLGVPADLAALTSLLIPTTAAGAPTYTITVDPTANGATTVNIPFVAIDAAGKESSNTNGTSGTAILDFQSVSIYGTVFNDVNGLNGTPVNTVDGTGTNAGSTLSAILYDNTTNKVAGITTVAADGTYSFSAKAGDDFNVYLTTNTVNVATVGQTTRPTVTMPAGWVTTGEHLGTVTGSDGIVDGILPVGAISNVTYDADFGIEQPPTVGKGANTAPNPGSTTQVTVPANTFTNLANSTDPTTNTVTGIRITGFPSGATSMFVNGVQYFANNPSDVTVLTGLTIPTTATGAPTYVITVDPTADGATSVSIPFVVIDEAGKVSTNTASAAGTAVLTFPTVGISGSVFNDPNGLNGTPSNTVDGTGTNAGGINAVLYDATAGKVVGVTAVAADGTYSFAVTPGANNYTIYVTTNSPAINSTAVPVIALPAGWASTGEHLGANAGNDGGNPNSILSIGAVTTNAVTNANFGIERMPTANAAFYTIPQPADHSSKALITGNNMGNLVGNDVDDGAMGAGKHVIITSIASMNGNELYYLGTKVTPGFDIPDYNPADLSIKFQGGRSTNAVFAFAFVDAAGKQGSPANYTISWTTPLPVQLISFEGTPNACTALITWKTAVEKDVANFEVMRSEDGISFTSAATETARGDNSYYQAKVANESDAFFKLKMNDLNGNYTYSATIRINTACNAGAPISLSPNPAVTEVKLTNVEPGSTIAMMDMYGRKVLEVTAAQNNLLNVSQLQPGSYVIQVTKNGNLVGNLRFVKQ